MVYRSISIVITLIVVLALNYPRLFITISLLIIIFYLLINMVLIPWLNRLNHSQDEERRRKFALNKAKMFLSPYKNIWGNLRLSNKYCYLYLDKDGVTIKCNEKTYPYRSFRILNSSVHSYKDLWNMFCKNFSHNTSYDGMVETCKKYQVSIFEYAIQTQKQSIFNQSNEITLNTKQETEKLDINNCSEIELTALPGISIVMAKKAIKKREEIGGYKTIEDFFLYMKLKPHMERQLREKIMVKKMKISKKNIKNSERSVDL